MLAKISAAPVSPTLRISSLRDGFLAIEDATPPYNAPRPAPMELLELKGSGGGWPWPFVAFKRRGNVSAASAVLTANTSATIAETLAKENIAVVEILNGW